MKAFFYYLAYIFYWIFAWLPLKVQYIISDLLFFSAFYLLKYRKKVVLLNLTNAFPDKTPQEIASISKKFYQHFCDSLVETFALLHMSKKEIRKRFRYKNPELINAFYKEGKSIIAVIGHYGNWEWNASLPLVIKHSVLAVYKPLRNRFMDKLFIRLRGKFGVVPVPMSAIVKKLHQFKENNQPTYSIFLTDQRPQYYHIKYWTTFLNQETPVYLGAEKIGKKLGSAIVYVKVSKIKRGYYELEFITLIEDTKNTKDFEITEKHVRILEQTIQEQPEMWLWSHRRWKHKRPVENEYG